MTSSQYLEPSLRLLMYFNSIIFVQLDQVIPLHKIMCLTIRLLKQILVQNALFYYDLKFDKTKYCHRYDNKPIASGCKTSINPFMSLLSYKPPSETIFVSTPSIQSLIHTKSYMIPQPIFRRRLSYCHPLYI